MSANGNRQVEETSGPFDPDLIPALEDLRKHLDWFLKVDEVLVPKKCFSNNLSDSTKKTEPGQHLELVVYGGAPKNFFNWVNRAVGGSERVLRNPAAVTEPLGVKDVIMFQNEIKPLPPDRLVHGVHIFSLPTEISQRKAVLQGISELARAQEEIKVFVYVTNAEREYLIWKQVKEASGQMDANKVAWILREMHKEDKSVEELSREDAKMLNICKSTRFRQLIAWKRSDKRAKPSTKKEPDLRNFLSNPPSRPGDVAERKNLPDLREVLEDRPPKRSGSDKSSRKRDESDRTNRNRSDRESRSREGDRKRRRSNDRSTRSGSRSERDPYDCLNFPPSKLKRFQKWNEHLEEFSSSVWPLVRQNETAFMDVIEECFKIHGVKHLICLVFLPQDGDEDLETWRGKIQSVFTEGSRMQLGFVAEMSWLNKGDDIHCVRIRNSKNYSRTVYIIQHPSQLLAENIPQQLHSIYITKLPQYDQDLLFYLGALRAQLVNRQHWLSEQRMRIRVFLSPDEMDFSFCHVVSRHLSAKSIGTALRLFRLCRVEDRNELRRLVSHRINSDACLSDPAVMDFLSNLSLGASHIFRGVPQDNRTTSSSSRSEVGKKSSTVTSEMKMTAEEGADVDAYSLQKVLLDRQREELENKKKALAAMREDYLRDLFMEDQFRVRKDEDLCTMEDVIQERQQLERQNEELAALREKLLREEVEKEHVPTSLEQQRVGQEFQSGSLHFRQGSPEVELIEPRSVHFDDAGPPPSGLLSYLRRTVGGTLGEDMVFAWNAAGHSEQSLAEMVRDGPSSINETKILLMNELLNIPHERIPANVRIGELVQVTAEFFYPSPRIGHSSFTPADAPKISERSSFRELSPPRGRDLFHQRRQSRSHSRSKSPVHRTRMETLSRRESQSSFDRARSERKGRNGSSHSPLANATSSAWESNEGLPKVRINTPARPAAEAFSRPAPVLDAIPTNAATIAKHGISFPPPAIPPLMSRNVTIPPLMSKDFNPPPPRSGGSGALLPYPPPTLNLPDPRPRRPESESTELLIAPLHSKADGRTDRTLVEINLDDQKVDKESGQNKIRDEPTPPPPGEVERNERPQIMHEDHTLPPDNLISASTPPPGELDVVSVKSAVGESLTASRNEAPSIQEAKAISNRYESQSKTHGKDGFEHQDRRHSTRRRRSQSPEPYMSSGRHRRRSRSPARFRSRSRSPGRRRSRPRSPARCRSRTPPRKQVSIYDLQPSASQPQRQEKHPLLRYMNQSRIDNCQALYDDVTTFFAKKEFLERMGNLEKGVAECVREATPGELVVVLKGEGDQLSVKHPEINKIMRAAGGERYSLLLNKERGLRSADCLDNKTVVIMTGYQLGKVSQFPVKTVHSIHLYNVPDNRSRSNYRSGFFSSLIALWSKNPLARLHVYLGAQSREFFVWKSVQESHGPEAAIRALRAIKANADHTDRKSMLDLVPVTISPRIARLAEYSKSEPDKLPERLPSIFTNEELEDLGKTIFDFERPFDPVDEIRVPRADLEARLKLCQAVLKKSQSSQVALVYTFTDTETVLESVLRVGQASVLDCRSGYVQCSEENLAGKHFVVMQPLSAKNRVHFPQNRAHSIHITNMPRNPSKSLKQEALKSIRDIAQSNPEAPVFLYAQSLESDYSIWRYVDSLGGNADLAVSGVRMLRNKKTPTPEMKSAYRLCLTYYKLKELVPGSRVHSSLSVEVLPPDKNRVRRSDSEDRHWNDAMSKIAEAIGKGPRRSSPARVEMENQPGRREVKRETRSPSIEILETRRDVRERPRGDLLSSISKDSLQKLLATATGVSSHKARPEPVPIPDSLRGWGNSGGTKASVDVYSSASATSSFEPHVSSSAWSSSTTSPGWSAAGTASATSTGQSQSRPVYELASLRGATASQPGDDPAEQYRKFIRMQEEERKWRQEECRREALAREQEEHRRIQEFESSTQLREMRDSRMEQPHPSFVYGTRDPRLESAPSAAEPMPRSSPSPIRSDLSARDPDPNPEALAQWLGLHDFVLDLLLRQHPSVRESYLLATAAAVRRAMALTGLRLPTLLSWMARSGADFVTRVIRGKLSNCLKGSLPAEDAAKLVVEYLEQKSR